MAQHLKLIKPDKTTGTSVDTIMVTKEIVKEWKLPPFQRPLRPNAKVMALAEEFKSNDGVFPGILTIGILKGAKYLVDGQHRVAAFTMSDVEEGYSDVRYRYYDSMAEMADDFVRLNSVLVKMRPDDILRGLEGSSAALTKIRTQCTFVGYDQIRRGTANPIVSMSALLRCWFGSSRDIPASAAPTAMEVVNVLTDEDSDHIINFLNMAMRAWGRDPEYFRLWSNLNLTMCMWIYRRVVLKAGGPRVPKISKEMFVKMLTALTASADYLEWLVGRNLSDRDRSPCYRRVKQTFVKRLEAETGTKAAFPAPEWAAK